MASFSTRRTFPSHHFCHEGFIQDVDLRARITIRIRSQHGFVAAVSCLLDLFFFEMWKRGVVSMTRFLSIAIDVLFLKSSLLLLNAFL
jgi:hypothetical protein